MESITREQADVIGEVANICTGTAATALSLIINRATNITTPTVEVLAQEELLERDDHILVKVPYTKGLDGTNLMVMDVKDALIIANLMMGGDGLNPQEDLNDIHMSAVGEAMNQMMGTVATSLSTMFNKKIDISPPKVNLIDLGAEDKVTELVSAKPVC